MINGLGSSDDCLAGKICLVLGAGGFVGTDLCRRLLKANARVRAFGHPPRFAAAARNVDWISADFTNADAVRDAVTGTNYVFHLLGGSDPASSNADPARELESNLLPSIRLLEACSQANVAKFIFISSGGTVYGPGTSVPTREDAATNPISAYGIGKLAVEKYIRLFDHIYGLNYAILRVANPFGPFQDPDRGQGVIAKLLKRAMTGKVIEIWGDGSVVRDFLYISDVSEALLKAAVYTGGERLFNIGSGVGRSLLDVASDISVLTGSSIPVAYASARVADIPISVLDCERARRYLGWVPSTTWQHGLTNTHAWLKTIL